MKIILIIVVLSLPPGHPMRESAQLFDDIHACEAARDELLARYGRKKRLRLGCYGLIKFGDKA